MGGGGDEHGHGHGTEPEPTHVHTCTHTCAHTQHSHSHSLTPPAITNNRHQHRSTEAPQLPALPRIRRRPSTLLQCLDLLTRCPTAPGTVVCCKKAHSACDWLGAEQVPCPAVLLSCLCLSFIIISWLAVPPSTVQRCSSLEPLCWLPCLDSTLLPPDICLDTRHLPTAPLHSHFCGLTTGILTTGHPSVPPSRTQSLHPHNQSRRSLRLPASSRRQSAQRLSIRRAVDCPASSLDNRHCTSSPPNGPLSAGWRLLADRPPGAAAPRYLSSLSVSIGAFRRCGALLFLAPSPSAPLTSHPPSRQSRQPSHLDAVSNARRLSCPSQGCIPPMQHAWRLCPPAQPDAFANFCQRCYAPKQDAVPRRPAGLDAQSARMVVRYGNRLDRRLQEPDPAALAPNRRDATHWITQSCRLIHVATSSVWSSARAHPHSAPRPCGRAAHPRQPRLSAALGADASCHFASKLACSAKRFSLALLCHEVLVYVSFTCLR